MIVTKDTDDMTTNEKAETLRGLVFNQSKIIKSKYGEYHPLGCYSTLELNAGFEKIDPQKYPVLYREFAPGEPDPYWGGGDIEVTAYESEDIVAMWWWDGDGSLLLWIIGEPTALVSHDCKHDDEWREIEA